MQLTALCFTETFVTPAKQRRHCPRQPRPLWPRSGVEPEPLLRGCVGGVVAAWRLGPMGYWMETLQCHIPFRSPFC